MLLQLLLQMPFSERQPVTVLNRAVLNRAVADAVAVAVADAALVWAVTVAIADAAAVAVAVADAVQ